METALEAFSGDGGPCVRRESVPDVLRSPPKRSISGVLHAAGVAGVGISGVCVAMHDICTRPGAVCATSGVLHTAGVDGLGISGVCHPALQTEIKLSTAARPRAPEGGHGSLRTCFNWRCGWVRAAAHPRLGDRRGDGERGK